MRTLIAVLAGACAATGVWWYARRSVRQDSMSSWKVEPEVLATGTGTAILWDVHLGADALVHVPGR